MKSEYEAGEVDSAVAHTVREISKKANIKGFRKGHIPRKTLELYFGRDGIYRETVENLAQQALENIVAEYDLDLIAEPNLKLDELEEGKPMALTFTFEVRPEVTLPDFASLEAEKTVYGVEDSDVDDSFRQILESNAKFEPVDEDRIVTMEDIVEAQYTSSEVLDDGTLKELEHDQKNTLSLATLRKDIAEAVAGHGLAEEFTFDITLEDDYPDLRMAGKTVRYDMEILQIMKRVVPEATDEVISELSQGKYATVEALRTELRKQMDENAAEHSDGSLRESAIKVAAAAATVDIPESMIQRQYDAMRKEQDGDIRRDLNQSIEEYLEKNNLSVDEFEGNLKKRAEEIVRNTLVLDALAERDDISFTADEMNEEIVKIARSLRANPQEVADLLAKDRDEFASVAMRVRTRNTIKHLASLVKVKEVAPPAPETDAPKSDTEASPEA